MSLGLQWIKDIKQKKKEEKQRELEKNIGRNPRQIDIKRFYKESSSSEEERKRTKKTIKRIASPPKVLCRLVQSVNLSGLSPHDELFRLI